MATYAAIFLIRHAMDWSTRSAEAEGPRYAGVNSMRDLGEDALGRTPRGFRWNTLPPEHESSSM